jgi:hypothetical protein
VFWQLDGTARAENTAQRIYLSGHGKDDAIPWKFQCTTGAQSGFWTNISVPSCWDVKGFGTLNYYRDLTNAWSERGLYSHDFVIPNDWTKGRVFLVFEGVMTDCEATFNGHTLQPIHQGSFYRFKYEVTDLVSNGVKNNIEVTVSKHSANASVNKAERVADYWVFGGIFRPVYLERQPDSFIDRVAINAKADGTFSANVFGDHVPDGSLVSATIKSIDGRHIASIFTGSFTNDKVVLKTKVGTHKNWTAETPNLYKLEVSLLDGTNISCQLEKRFGFRTMEVRDGDGLYVNGARIILKGVCRHSFWPDSGRTLSTAVHKLDIETIKDMNMNAVRMSHYPPDEEFLDLCDEMGLYVLDELGGWHQYYDTNVGPRLLKEMITRDVNHPSILFWDNGNEGGFNTNFDSLFAQYDPQHRRVLHPWATFGGLCTAHYLAYDKAAEACKGISVYYSKGQEIANTNDHTKYIYMPTEFNHGLFDGGAGAGLQDLWNLMTSSKTLGGGFIWALLDEGVKRLDNGRIDVAGNQAPDGIVGPYRQREASFYAIKSIWSPITIATNQSMPSRKIVIKNNYAFLNTKNCKFAWKTLRFPGPFESATNAIVIATGSIKSPSISPGKTGTLHLALPKEWETADALELTIIEPGGREIDRHVWPLKGIEHLHSQAANRDSQTILSTKTTNGVDVCVGDRTFSFSKSTGMLIGVRAQNHSYSLTNGPLPAFGDFNLTSFSGTSGEGGYLVESTYTGGLKKVSWHISTNGWLQCDYTYTAKGLMDYHGVTFDYPEAKVRSKRWVGDGPYRVWKNRLQGVNIGLWENNYNNTITGYSGWNYPEFKGCFANVHWMQYDTDEGKITAVLSTPTFVKVLSPDFPPKELSGKTGIELPKSGFAVLNAIPPTGTKFKEAKYTGPSGEQNMATGDYSGSVKFFFGELVQ